MGFAAADWFTCELYDILLVAIEKSSLWRLGLGLTGVTGLKRTGFLSCVSYNYLGEGERKGGGLG